MAAVWEQLPGTIWLGVAGAVCVALLSGWLRSATFKGWWGEYLVQRWLAQGLDAQHYHCAHNVTLRLADGTTTQIDHVVVSPYGVFVLETKHLQGWIFGGDKQRTWTQHLYRHRSSFQNPLRQNWLHIKALEAVLQLPLQHLHSLVVFTGDCHFKTAMPPNVTQGRACIDWILRHQHTVLSAETVARLVQTLSQQRLQATRATHTAHVAQLHARHAQHQVRPRQVAPVRKAEAKADRPALAPAAMAPEVAPTTAPVPPAQHCPDCGHSLVRRSLPNKLGAPQYFLRCGRFPHCRFLQTLAEPVL